MSNFGRQDINATAQMTAPASIQLSILTGMASVHGTVTNVVTSKVASIGANRRRLPHDKRLSIACQLFDASTGTTTSAMAVGLGKTSDNSGTTTKGRPTPNAPLTVPPRT